MPVKIGFQVVSCTGEDDRYRVSELNYHGPTVRGWRSAFNCPFPQEIVLRLDVTAILQQIQILVHQYLIPRKIEICTNDDTDEASPSENSQPRFQYLGFITFSDNTATGFRSRELKSILIPSTKAVKLIKLKIHENHANSKNIFNQVGIIGINILGDEIDFRLGEGDHGNTNVAFHRWISRYSESTAQNSNYISPYDDLAFEMYVDEETAKIIKILVQKKQQAVLEEDFERANILKITLEDLRAAGEILGLYEQEKKQAIQVEDFDRAKLKKLQIADFREKVYSSLNIRSLLNQSEDDETLHPDDINNDNVMESAFQTVSQSKYREKCLDNAKSIQRSSYTDQNTPHSHLIHSRSQVAFSEETDFAPSTHHQKNLTFTSSVSNPQLHQYLKDAQQIGESEPPVEPDYEERSSSPSSNSSDSSGESAVFNAFTSESLDYASLPILPSEERFAETEANETLTRPRWNGARTPTEIVPERSRSRAHEASRVRSKSVTTGTGKSSFEAYEDRMLPALRSYHGNEVVRECQLAFDQQPKTSLNERERKQALLPISVFGMEMVEKFYSKNFNEKEEGLKLLRQELKRVIDSGEGTNGIICGSHNKMARGAIFLLHRALRDKVYSVYSGAAETIRLFFTGFVPRRVSSSEVARSVDKLLPELLTKSGDVTPRIHNMAAHTILSMAECEEVRRLNIIPSHLSRPLMSSVHPRLALSRLEMVEQLILNHGISKDKRSGLTCRTLAEFGSSGLHHPAEAVRKVSERILVHVYKVNPRMVRKQLPPDDNVTRRNLLYRHLFQEFDFLDVQRKLSEEGNNVDEKKQGTGDRQDPQQSTDRKGFSIINNNINHVNNNNNNQHEGEKRKGSNFDSQLKTIKNFMALNMREKNANATSPEKCSVSCKSGTRNDDRVYNQIQKDLPPKPNFRFELGSKLFKRNPIERKIEKRNNGNDKSPPPFSNGANKVETKETTVKFPCLTDSIDTTRARLLFHQKQNGKAKKIDCGYSTNDSVKLLPGTVNVRKNVNLSSGIPLPTFGFSKKHYTSGKKVTKHEKTVEERSAPAKTKTFIPKMKPFMRNTTEWPKDKKNCIKNDKMNLPCTNNRTFLDIFDRHSPVKNVDKTNRFSESMLASIKENGLLEDSSPSGLENIRTTLKTCIFCMSSEKWTTDDTLNEHYLSDCPMLTTCEYCTEVIEISGFNNHLLDECTQKHLFQKCSTCQQPLLADLLDNHECAGSSNSYKARCPFCHEDIGEGDSCWRKHLMGKNFCTNHPRPPQ